MKKVMSKFGAFMLALFTVISCINYYPAQNPHSDIEVFSLLIQTA